MTFEATFRRFHKQLCYFACGLLHDIDDAQDVVQNTFIKFWKHEYDGTEKEIEALLYKMVKNGCIDRLKGAAKQIRTIPIEDYDTAEEEYINFAFIAEVESLLIADIYAKSQSLPRKCRRVFELTFFQGKGTRQICDIMGISVQNVLNQKQRALQLLRISFKL